MEKGGVILDQIQINGLEFFANHGVFQEETVLGQKFIVSVVLFVDTQEAGSNDDLTKSVHYGEVSHEITKYMKEHTYQLIEAAAHHLALHLLEVYPQVESLRLKLEKPWAPVRLPLDSVAVEIKRGWHTVYLGLGSNIGDRQQYLTMAIEEWKAQPYCKDCEVSTFIETKPYGMTEQEDFLNGCLKLRTLLSPHQVLEKIGEIEKKADRKREVHWGPRTLDIDLLLYDDQIIETPDLIVPHPELHKRNFVLQPLEELSPRLLHPIYRKTIQQLRSELNE